MKHLEELIDHAIEGIQDRGTGTIGADLHNTLFNEDYYIIGTYQAEEWLEQVSTFDAIREVQKYEQDNFGKVSTDLSDPEKIVNMYVYIKGEEILAESETLQDCWDREISEEEATKIVDELNELK